MRKSFAAIVAAAGLVAIVGGQAAASTTIHVHGQIVGAAISGTQNVFKIHLSPGGNGAGVQTVKINSTATGGTSTAIVYWGNGTQSLAGPFAIGTPNAKGISTLTGSAHVVAGTGAYKGVKETIKVNGTINIKTFVFNASLAGTETK